PARRGGADGRARRGVVRHRGKTRHQSWPAADPALAEASGGLAADVDRRPRKQPAAQGTPLTPFAVVVEWPLGFHHVAQHQPGGDDLPNAVAYRAVLFDVHRPAVLARL